MNKKLLPFFATVGLGLSSAYFVKVSVFAFLLLVIAFAALGRLDHKLKGVVLWALVLATISTSVGMARFIWGEALPGIAEERGRASGKRAVSFLREVLFAQDAARRYGMIDPDGDGVGSAGRLGELSGYSGARAGAKLNLPPLDLRYAPRTLTRAGPATEQEGYLIIVCLPGRKTSWVTEPAAEVDDEQAETRWVAYAWPAAPNMEHETAYFIDEHERILESANLLQNVPGAQKLRLVGPGDAPECSDALDRTTAGNWKPWAGKKPRSTLPGAPARL